jgi:hypothetical protein
MVEGKNQRNVYLGCTDENRILCEEYAAGVSVRCELVPEHRVALTKEILTKRVCRHEPSHQKMENEDFLIISQKT